MNMFHPSALMAFLQSIGANAKKSLSQNFLIDGNIIKKIIASAGLHEGDLVIEIGSGPGALTQALLEKNVHVIAIEKDHLFAKALRRLDPTEKSLSIFNEDVMDFDFDKHLKNRKAKIVANIPYHLTTPILTMLIPKHQAITSCVFMVQEEVAKRMVAQPGNKDYSSLTVFLNYYSKIKYAFKVSRNCFYPKPKVHSAIVTLHPHSPADIADEKAFFKMVRTAFCYRRKMLRTSLKDIYPQERIQNALIKLGHTPEARPERLSLDDFLQLFDILRA